MLELNNPTYSVESSSAAACLLPPQLFLGSSASKRGTAADDSQQTQGDIVEGRSLAQQPVCSSSRESDLLSAVRTHCCQLMSNQLRLN